MHTASRKNCARIAEKSASRTIALWVAERRGEAAEGAASWAVLAADRSHLLQLTDRRDDATPGISRGCAPFATPYYLPASHIPARLAIHPLRSTTNFRDIRNAIPPPLPCVSPADSCIDDLAVMPTSYGRAFLTEDARVCGRLRFRQDNSCMDKFFCWAIPCAASFASDGAVIPNLSSRPSPFPLRSTTPNPHVTTEGHYAVSC